MNKMNRHSTRQHGLSLIELLIASAIGLFLVLGVVEVFVNARVLRAEVNARQAMQEGARVAMSFIGDELRMSGYLGCFGSLGNRPLNILLSSPPASFQPWFGVQGWEASGTDWGAHIGPAADLALIDVVEGGWEVAQAGHVLPSMSALPTSDLIRTWAVAGVPSPVVSVSTAPLEYAVSSVTDIRAGDMVLVSDCARADIVQACELQAIPDTEQMLLRASQSCSPGNRRDAVPLTTASTAAPAEAMRVQATLFYVGRRGGVTANPPALFRRTLDDSGGLAAAEEIIEGVESLQLLYGVDSGAAASGQVGAYLSASEVTDFSRVVSVRVNLLMVSVGFASSGLRHDYNYHGAEYSGALSPNDGRLRQSFEMTFHLRNRALGL